jgi:hypothetical protein
VCIRPQHVRLAAGPEGVRACVVATEFLGEAERLTLDVVGVDSPLLLRVPGRARLSPGDVVFLDVNASDIVVVPDDAG